MFRSCATTIPRSAYAERYDFKLPGITGLAFTKLAKEIRPHTPVVLLTGYGNSELVKDAHREGAYSLLNKPLHREALQRVIGDALTHRPLLHAECNDVLLEQK